MVKETLDENIDKLLKEESATTKAVESLITVKDRVTGKASEVELKTDLSDDEIKLHTVLAVTSDVLEMDEKTFKTKCILADVIEKKERKALSKNRKSREEIVMVARQPDIQMGGMGGMPQKDNFVKRFFSSRRKDELG